MAQATFSVRMDETLKQQFDTLCADIGMQAFLALRAEAKKNGVQDLTLDEINEEIRQVRCGGE